MSSLRGVVLSLALCACRSTPAPADAARDTPAADVPGDVPPDAPVDISRDLGPPSEHGVGTACGPGADCDQGLLCGPLPGGYCTAFCRDVPCPPHSVCVDSIRAGEICMARCSGDDECRAGYTCDPARGVCTAEGNLGPVPPRCSEAAPTRRVFGPVRQLTAAGGAGAGDYDFEPTGSLLSDGRLVLTYTRGAANGSPNQLGTALVATDGTVSVGAAIVGLRGHYFDPWMATGRDGAAQLVWLNHEGGSPDRMPMIAMASTRDGRAWTSAERVDHREVDCPNDRAGCLDKPMIAVGPDRSDPARDAVYVVYSAAGGVRVRRSTDAGRSFGPSRRVPVGNYGDVAVAGDGVLHVTGITFMPSGEGAFGSVNTPAQYARSEDGGESFTAARVSRTDESVPTYFSNTQVRADAQRGAVYVAYTTGTPDGVWNIVLATSRDGGRTFSRTPVTAGHCANHMTPSLAVDPATGRVFVAWLGSEGGGHVAMAECEALGARCGAPERVSDAPFAAYGLTRHSLRWLGEYGAFVLDPQRRRLHYAWTQTVTEGGRAVSRVFYSARGI